LFVRSKLGNRRSNCFQIFRVAPGHPGDGLRCRKVGVGGGRGGGRKCISFAFRAKVGPVGNRRVDKQQPTWLKLAGNACRA